jgi:hypothetical protein
MRECVRRTAKSLKELLGRYKSNAGLAMHWIWMGPSGQKTRPAGGGVLQHYTMCDPEPAAKIKTIANTWFLDGTAVHPHNHEYRCRSPL